MKLKELIEQKNQKIDQLDEMLKTAETEKRAFTDEENERFETLENEIRALDQTIQAAERADSLERIQSGVSSESEEQRALDDKKAFLSFVRGETRAIGVDTSSGGSLIPNTIAQKIIEEVKEICPIYSKVTTYNVGGDLTFPLYDETEDKVQAAFVEDMQELTEHSGKFSTITLTNFIVGALTLVSKSLLNRTDFDLLSFIVSKVASAFAEFLEKTLLLGASGKMQGVCESKNIVTAAAVAALTSDELIDLQDMIPDRYQANACWIMSKKTRNALKKLKDTEGNYILNRDITGSFGHMLLGKPIYISDSMPDMAAGKIAIAYGDMSGLYLKFAQQMEVQVLNEKYATQHAVGVIGYAEMDSKIVEPQKIAVMKMKAGS